MIFNKDLNRLWRSLIAFFIAMVITIPVACHSSFIHFIDLLIDGSVQVHENEFFKIWYNFISFIGSPKIGIFWILLIAFFLWGFKYKIQALWGLGLVIGGDIFNDIIKHLIRRPRPEFHPSYLKGYSFPSTHTMSTFLIICVIWLIIIPNIKRRNYRWLVRIGCIFMVAMIMASRIYLNAHYFTDTFGAITFGYLWLQISEYLYIIIAPHLKHYKLTHHSYI